MWSSVTLPSGSNSSKCRPPSSAASWRGEIPALPATTRSLSRSRRVTCVVMAAETASRRVATLIARVKNHGGLFRRGAGVAKPGCPHPLQKYRCRGAGCPCPFQKMAVTPTSVPNPRHAHRLAVVERRQVELELGVLDGVGGQHVGAERRHAPLEAPAHVPGGALTGAPRREVARESLGHVDEHPAAQELVGAALGRVAVGARVIALADAPVERCLAPGQGRRRVSGLRSASCSGGIGPLSVCRYATRWTISSAVNAPDAPHGGIVVLGN